MKLLGSLQSFSFSTTAHWSFFDRFNTPVANLFLPKNFPKAEALDSIINHALA